MKLLCSFEVRFYHETQDKVLRSFEIQFQTIQDEVSLVLFGLTSKVRFRFIVKPKMIWFRFFGVQLYFEAQE